jgi:hypothetical protein
MSTTAANLTKAEVWVKPYPGFPLNRHPNGRLCKRIASHLRYFATADDWQEALRCFNRVSPYWNAGQEPPPEAIPLPGLSARQRSSAGSDNGRSGQPVPGSGTEAARARSRQPPFIPRHAGAPLSPCSTTAAPSPSSPFALTIGRASATTSRPSPTPRTRSGAGEERTPSIARCPTSARCGGGRTRPCWNPARRSGWATGSTGCGSPRSARRSAGAIRRWRPVLHPRPSPRHSRRAGRNACAESHASARTQRRTRTRPRCRWRC